MTPAAVFVRAVAFVCLCERPLPVRPPRCLPGVADDECLRKGVVVMRDLSTWVQWCQLHPFSVVTMLFGVVVVAIVLYTCVWESAESAGQ